MENQIENLGINGVTYINKNNGRSQRVIGQDWKREAIILEENGTIMNISRLTFSNAIGLSFEDASELLVSIQKNNNIKTNTYEKA